MTDVGQVLILAGRFDPTCDLVVEEVNFSALKGPSLLTRSEGIDCKWSVTGCHVIPCVQCGKPHRGD